MKKIFAHTPEAVLWLAVVHAVAAVVLARPQGPAFTAFVRGWLILAVLGALSCWPLSVMLYAARPWLYGAAARGKRPDTTWMRWAIPVVFALPGLALIPVASLLLAMSVSPTAYEPRVLMLIVAWAFCLGPAVVLLVMRDHPGPSRRLAGPLRVWHLALLLLVAMSVAAWPLAAWNPTLRHGAMTLRVVRAAGMSGLAPGSACRLEVGWFPGTDGTRCKLELHCGSRQLYGGYKRGAFDCTVRDRGLVIQGRDDDSGDGDPALWVDTIKGTLQLAITGRLPRDATLEAAFPQEAE